MPRPRPPPPPPPRPPPCPAAAPAGEPAGGFCAATAAANVATKPAINNARFMRLLLSPRQEGEKAINLRQSQGRDQSFRHPRSRRILPILDPCDRHGQASPVEVGRVSQKYVLRVFAGHEAALRAAVVERQRGHRV